MKKNWPIFVCFLISVFLIFYRFNQIPKNLDKDEVEFAKLALSLDKKPYAPYSPLATGHSTLYFYLILFSFKIFGINNFSLRFPAAFFGILNILIFYLIIDLIFKKFNFRFLNWNKNSYQKKILIIDYLPLIVSITLLSSHWYLNFARFSYEATFLLFLELASIYFFFLYLEVKRIKHLIFSSVLAGLAFNSYIPGRIFFLLPFFFLVKKSFKKTYGFKKILNKELLFFLIAFLIVIFPLSTYLFNHPDSRVEQLFFLSNENLTAKQKILYLWQNIKSNILMFSFKGDINGRHNYPGKPALNPILALFFYFGFFLAVRKIKNLYNFFFILYFFFSLLPTFFTYPWENPNMLRTYTALPAIVFFVSLGVLFFEEFLNFVFKKKSSFFYLSLIFFIIFLSSLYEIRTYFKYQSRVFDQSFKVKNRLEKIINK